MPKLKIGQKLKQLVGIAAPNLGKMLGGPLGGMAGNMIREGLGVDSDEAAAAMLETDPAAMAKVSEIEANLEARLAEAGVDLERVLAADRDSARQRQVALKDKTPAILAYMLTVGFFGVLFYMLRYGIPAEHGEPLLVMLGSLGTAWISAMVYYFGSTVGSKQKTALMARINGVSDADNVA